MKKYEFWSVNYRYEDCKHVEERPALIVNDANFFLCIKATTKSTQDDIFPINHWKEAGLNEPTYLRLTKLFKSEKQDFVKMIGKLHKNDKMRLELALLKSKKTI